MTILDIFSWLPAKELSLEEIENIVIDLENGISHEGYFIEHQRPAGANENIVNTEAELVQEGKKFAFY